jgi:2-polyprenyl-3-methyl-5-hydroxy-6-metoxy-1,4-benzoquinol methylase
MLRLASSLVLILLSAAALAQAQPKPADPGYEPQVGQEGKDVVWVPTPQVVVDKMLDMAKLTPKDYLMDLGSGDGRTVITAAKRGARALGIEYNPSMVTLSERNAKAAGVSDHAHFRKADLFETDFSQATVITMFLLPQINLKLRPKILALKPGTRVVSNTFTMDDWEPDEKADLTSTCDAHYCSPMLWIVPAHVAGTHKLPSGGQVVLKQTFQMLSGTVSEGGKKVPLTGKVNGTQVSFTAEGKAYHATAKGKELVFR